MLNEYYQNIGYKDYLKRYGLVNAIKRGIFTTIPFHIVSDYEMKKLLWQKKVSRRAKYYLRKYKTLEPEGLVFTKQLSYEPIWIYWNKGMENAPEIVKKCYESVIQHSHCQVVLLTEENQKNYIIMPDYIEEKRIRGTMPLAVYTDLMRFALLEHYGGTWIDATVYLTDEIPKTILESNFFVFHDALGLLKNPALYPVWFIRAKKNESLMKAIKNVSFAYWKYERHVEEYLMSNIIITQVVEEDDKQAKRIPYLNSDYSEYLVKVLDDEYSEDKMNWIKGLTSIHKLTYKLDRAIDRDGTIYRHIVSERI